MSGRPEILFPLFAALSGLPGIGPKSAQALVSTGIQTPRDLLFTLPYAGIDRRLRNSVRDVQPTSVATVVADIGAHHPARRKGLPYRVDATDALTTFQLVFFHAREEWIKSRLPVGAKRLISGKIELFDGVLQMVHPDHMLDPEDESELPAFEPVYSQIGGVSPRTVLRATTGLLERVPHLGEWIDGALLRERKWPDWQEAISTAHQPANMSELALEAPARQRLAYDEIFAHQVTLALARSQKRKGKGRPTLGNGALRSKVRAALPYAPTKAQDRAIGEITGDMAVETRMNRLLQGDVGSGKTLVALMALLNAVEDGGQGVLMAPTEILARQHLATLQPLAGAAQIVVEALTGRDKGKERAAKLAALARGDIHILVGTHAVFQDDVVFQDLRLAVVDEQHRFGVAQRPALGRKDAAADVLVMTATPIPRSLSLAQYGDMDVSVLDEKPPGRTPVTTALISNGRMDEVVNHLRAAVGEGRQAYWVCPLVDESEVSDLTAAEERFKRLRAVFGEGQVGLVHGQMPPGEKDASMAAFQSGAVKVLVSTTVIEVGVDVPNASIMVIERAENFGLAQLHQLRGRVGRGAQASTCLLMYQTPLSESGQRRLEILRETDDGFRIAEEDLAMRGAGDLIGTAQSGLPRFRIADIERQSGLMALAQSDARKLLHDDPKLESERGQAVRVLLWLMEQDKAIQLISVG